MGRSIAWIWLCLLLLANCKTRDIPVVDSLDVTTTVAAETLPPPAITFATRTPQTDTAQPTPLPQQETTAEMQPTLTRTPVVEGEPISNDRLLLTTQNGEDVLAHRVGDGVFKVVLIGDRQPLVSQLYQHFVTHPEQIPAQLSVWFVPNMNPDGAHDVIRDADAGFDGCERNEGNGKAWISAESHALRTFLDDAVFVAFYENAPQNVIHYDSCGQNRMAQTMVVSMVDNYANNDVVLAESRLPRTVGHFIDYLTARGTAAITLGIRDTEAAAHPAATAVFLQQLAREFSEGETVWLQEEGLAVWEFSADTLIHPLAVTELNGTTFLLDSGRILAITADGSVRPILREGDDVGDVRVLGLLDLADDGTNLLALDRAGDVYRYADGRWEVERYDRPIRDRSAHYYVALAAAEGMRRNLIETSAPLLLRYDDTDEKRSTLPLDMYPIDVAVAWEGDAKWSYVLVQEKTSPFGSILQFENGVERGAIELAEPLTQARQIEANDRQLVVTDLDGRRIRLIARDTHEELTRFRFADNRPITAISATPTLTFVGRDALFRMAEPSYQLFAMDTLTVSNRAHDSDVLAQLVNLNIPIGIPQFIQRDYQMAGAPRHYRLGVHEGFDFYWQRGSQVHAAGSGTVIRADWEYQEPYAELFDLWRGQSYQLGYTSDEANDFFRGRQVWIDHGDGIVTRYVHLSAIDWTVQVGAWVEAGQVIAQVGNSGSPASIQGENEDSHLHFELWIGEGYLGEWIRPIEARYWLREILR